MPHVAFVAIALLVPEVPAPTAAVRQAVERALPLLAKGASGHADQKSCFACHNQAFPMVAFAAARTRGFEVSVELIAEQSKHIHGFLDSNRKAFTEGRGTGGQVDTA